MPTEITLTLWKCIRGHKHRTLELAQACDNMFEIKAMKDLAEVQVTLDSIRRRREQNEERRKAQVTKIESRKRREPPLTSGEFVGLTPRAVKPLHSYNYSTREQVAAASQAKLLSIPGLGRETLAEILLWLT